MFRRLYALLKWAVTRVMVFASAMDVLLKASKWFGWESVPHWPVVRFYNPERYAPFVGLTGGWSPFGSWHNSYVLGGFAALVLVYGFLVQTRVLWAVQMDSLTVPEEALSKPHTLARMRPIARPYFVWLLLASVGSIIALWSPEIFKTTEAVPLFVQLLLAACLASVAVANNTFILTGDLERIAERASGV